MTLLWNSAGKITDSAKRQNLSDAMSC